MRNEMQTGETPCGIEAKEKLNFWQNASYFLYCLASLHFIFYFNWKHWWFAKHSIILQILREIKAINAPLFRPRIRNFLGLQQWSKKAKPKLLQPSNTNKPVCCAAPALNKIWESSTKAIYKKTVVPLCLLPIAMRFDFFQPMISFWSVHLLIKIIADSLFLLFCFAIEETWCGGVGPALLIPTTNSAFACFR